MLLYHIFGCGLCADCRRGYFISCTSPHRAAYGWQRDGGHADLLLAEESTCILLRPPVPPAPVPDTITASRPETAGRATALSSTRRWGRAALVGEGGRLEIDASPTLIHPRITLYGSWVRFAMTEASDAYATADAGVRGKVALVMA